MDEEVALDSAEGAQVRGGGLLLLGAAFFLLAPVSLPLWLSAQWSRWRLARTEWVRGTLVALGINVDRCQIQCRPLGHGNMNAVLLVTLTGNGEEQRIVLKQMLRFGSFLGWAARAFGAMCEYPQSMSRTARFQRELDALQALQRAGVAVPQYLGASAELHVIAMKWIAGVDLSSVLKRQSAVARELGRLLAQIHEQGMSMGDANPRNFVVSEAGLFPFDFETSHVRATAQQKGFDLAWAAAFLPDDAALDSFYAGYGPRSAVLDAGIATARSHLIRFWPLIDLFAWKWHHSTSSRSA